MVDTVIMPKLGFDMSEGTLVRWVIGEGKEVAKGAVLAEIETDKATVEVESTFEGTLLRCLVKQGEIVPVNTPIALIGKPGEQVDAPLAQAAVQAQKSAGEALPTQLPVSAEVSTSAVESGLPGGVKASPLARRIAGEKGIDLMAISGSGPGGRVIKKDVEAFNSGAVSATLPEQIQPVITSPLSQPVSPPQVKSVTPEAKQTLVLPVFIYTGETRSDESIPLNRLRAAIGRRMVEVKGPVPHFYVTHEYNMNAVMALRKQVNALLLEDQKISVNDFILKAVALALRQYPNLNAALRGNQIVRFGAVNIGVAVAVDGGLLTVVCKDADRKSLRQIAVEVRDLANKVREGKVRPADIEGSTFSISNLGMFDVESFIAILNPPEAAILAVGSAREVPVVENGEIKPGWRLKATISVDHRVSDGAEAAQFLQILAQYLEQPLTLML